MKFLHFLKSARQSRVYLLFMGMASLIWFLIRVIPKPSRATYPCMVAAAPIMSGFILYLIGLGSSLWFLKKQNRNILYSRSLIFFIFLTLPLYSFRDSSTAPRILLHEGSYIANAPIGEGKGIYPGRVVWVHDAEVTREDVKNAPGDCWYMDKNCNQELVEEMLQVSLLKLSGESTAQGAWDALFQHFNETHGRGNSGYQNGESIAVKINLTNSYNGNTTPAERMDATPQLVLALLKQLVEIAGIPQDKIWLGDSYRTFRTEYWNKCHSIYPDVHYMDGTGFNGREKTLPSPEQVLKFSDKTNPNNGKANTSSLPQHYVDATYLINMPCLKSHEAGGITIAAKNHQGSVLEEGTKPENQFASFMHYSFPSFNPAMKSYRHLVDYMGHKDLGGKTLLYIVDGIWAGRESSGWLEKWNMSPFNGDWPSSLFLSQDPVAIESVCFDFLLEEYREKEDKLRHPYLAGTDDYLLQAADPAYWPEGLVYDPEGDGSPLNSLGVYEHWNNATEKAYTRNLGTGPGIELVKAETSTALPGLNVNLEYNLYPNPFKERITLQLEAKDIELTATIYDAGGRKILSKEFRDVFNWDGASEDGFRVQPGLYILCVCDRLSGSCKLKEKIILE